MIIKCELIKCLNQAVTSFLDADMALYYIYEMNYMYVTHISLDHIKFFMIVD